jgi:hypothetical protein
MSTGNQTLLLSGSLLSNAATELAQTLRVDLVQLLDQSVANLTRYGLSETSIAIMKQQGFVILQDLNFLQVSHLRSMGFPAEEIQLLTQICSEVRRTISVGSLSKILKNASKNITEIAAALPIKNTFIEFPNLFQSYTDRHPQSCPAFFLEEEREALAALERSIHQQQQRSECPTPAPSVGFIDRPPEKSRGSESHGSGECKPCAWFHHPDGCRHASDCEFCHLCPNGEIKKRKKEKQKMIRAMKDVTPITTPEFLNLADETDTGGTFPDIYQPVPARSGISGWLGSIFAK